MWSASLCKPAYFYFHFLRRMNLRQPNTGGGTRWNITMQNSSEPLVLLCSLRLRLTASLLTIELSFIMPFILSSSSKALGNALDASKPVEWDSDLFCCLTLQLLFERICFCCLLSKTLSLSEKKIWLLSIRCFSWVREKCGILSITIVKKKSK